MNHLSVSRRLDHIDGLRGIAAILVLFQHLIETIGAPANAWPESWFRTFLLEYIDFGKLGVVAFFAISGFIIPYSFRSASPRLCFGISRFFRLYPAYWLSIITAIVLAHLIGGRLPSPGQVALNFTMLQDLVGQPRVIEVYWTLFVELLFYVMCVASFSQGWLRSPKMIFLIFVSLLIAATGASIVRAHGGPRIPAAIPLYLSVMWFSTCLRLKLLENDRDAGRYSAVMFPIMMIAIVYVWTTTYDSHSHKESVFSSISGFYAALVLFLACAIRRLFCAKWLTYLGAISFSIYLFHPLAIDLAVFAGQYFAWPYRSSLIALLTVALTWGVAHLVYHCVEKPSIGIGRELIRKRIGDQKPSETS